MPRRSAAAASVPRVDGRRPRLTAPATLSDAEKKVFRELIAATSAEHFTPADLPLLCRYAEACVLAESAAREMRADGPVVFDRPSPWLVVQEKSVRAMVSLSMRLRLSPQSRLDPKSAARQKPDFADWRSVLDDTE